MKTLTLSYLLILLFFIVGCGGNNDKKTQKTDAFATVEPQCYRAIFEKDTAYLSIRVAENKKVQGDLLIRYSENPRNEGTFKGEFKGDTLLADFSYYIGNDKKTLYKNPLAFLAKNDSLILGIGEVETMAGRAFFKQGAPIDFEKGRFRFVESECKD